MTETARTETRETSETGKVGLEGRVLLTFATWNPAAFLADFEADWGEVPEVVLKSEQGIVVAMNNAHFILRFVEGKDPDAEVVAKNNREWTGAADAAANHLAHIEVTSLLSPEALVLRSARDFVRVMASLALQEGAAAIDTTNTLLTPEGYRNGAQVMTDGRSFPVHNVIYTGVWRSSEDGGTNGYTAGFNRFGLPELEIVDSKRGAYEVREFLRNLSGYILETGNPVRPDTTLRVSADEAFDVTLSAGVAFPEEIQTLKIAFG